MTGQREKPPYVLIAIPHRNRAAAYRAAVNSSEFETVMVRDGAEAREAIARRGPPLLLLVDLSLPVTDGFELLRELRAIAPREVTGAIVLSGHAAVRSAARRLSEQLGIAHVFPFDVDRTALVEAVEEELRELAASRGSVRRLEMGSAVQPPDPAEPLIEAAIDAAIAAAARRFAAAVTVAFVCGDSHEVLRGEFALSSPTGVVNAAHLLAFLRQVSGGADPLIVPNVASYPALAEIAPGGLTLVKGLAAAPFATAKRRVSGTLCVMDTQPLEIGAEDLEALEAIARDLAREIGAIQPEVPDAMPPEPRPQESTDVEILQRLASTDTLTGLANRRGGERDIGVEISRSARQNSPLSCALVDLDDFKAVNDRFGHQAGDYVLREIGALLRRTLRGYDIIVRWGGDEFLVVLPGVTGDQACRLAERLRSAIERLPLSGIGRLTASVGVAALGTDGAFDSMFATADRQLYQAKAKGGNSIACPDRAKVLSRSSAAAPPPFTRNPVVTPHRP